MPIYGLAVGIVEDTRDQSISDALHSAKKAQFYVFTIILPVEPTFSRIAKVRRKSAAEHGSGRPQETKPGRQPTLPSSV
jgi:hypothetical protein